MCAQSWYMPITLTLKIPTNTRSSLSKTGNAIMPSQDLWLPVDIPGQIPQAVVLDPDVSADFDIMYDEVADLYDGEYVPNGHSDLAMILILAKRCHQDDRYQGDHSKLEALIQEISRFASTALRRFPPVSPSMVSETPDLHSLGDANVNLRLALRLGSEILIIPKKGDQPVYVILSSVTRHQGRNYVTFWFSYDDELLSKQVPWKRLPELVSAEIWDLGWAVTTRY